MTRKQWAHRMKKYRLNIPFGYEYGDAWCWKDVVAISKLVVNAKRHVASFNIMLSSGKSILFDKEIEPQYTYEKFLFVNIKVPAKAQQYFDNPCEEFRKLELYRNNFIKAWVKSKN